MSQDLSTLAEQKESCLLVPAFRHRLRDAELAGQAILDAMGEPENGNQEERCRVLWALRYLDQASRQI